jgi:hypothetical protein
MPHWPGALLEAVSYHSDIRDAIHCWSAWACTTDPGANSSVARPSAKPGRPKIVKRRTDLPRAEIGGINPLGGANLPPTPNTGQVRPARIRNYRACGGFRNRGQIAAQRRHWWAVARQCDADWVTQVTE